MNVAEKMCDFIFMICKGRKVLDGTLAAIQDQYGSDTIRLRAEGGMSRLEGLVRVENAIDFGRLQELRMRPGADPQQVLSEIMSRTRVHSFEVAKPTLYDIFLRIAGEEARERDNA
jgi:ABC-2 type transport system ATP-binding protein